MQDKTFWSILGALLLGWVVLFYMLVVGGGMKEYKAKSKQLESKVKNMKKYSNMEADELPTESLLERKTAYIDSYEKNLLDAQRFFEDREARLLSGVNVNNKASWAGTYSDQYAMLGDKYRQANPVEDGEDPESLPFERLDQKILDGDLAQAERLWRTQKLVVEAVLEAGGKIIDSAPVSRTTIRSIEKDEEGLRPRFSVDRVNTVAALPANEITPILSEILGHSGLNLEIEQLVVGKDPKLLVTEVVVETKDGEEAPTEPPVLMSLSLNVLKYVPEPETREE